MIWILKIYQRANNIQGCLQICAERCVSNLQRDALFRRVKGSSDCLIRRKKYFFLFHFCCSFMKKMSAVPFKIMFIMSPPHELLLLHIHNDRQISHDLEFVSQWNNITQTRVSTSPCFFPVSKKMSFFWLCAEWIRLTLFGCLLCFWDNESWNCVHPYPHTDCRASVGKTLTQVQCVSWWDLFTEIAIMSPGLTWVLIWSLPWSLFLPTGCYYIQCMYLWLMTPLGSIHNAMTSR